MLGLQEASFLGLALLEYFTEKLLYFVSQLASLRITESCRQHIEKSSGCTDIVLNL
jgi:hypothetical protein